MKNKEEHRISSKPLPKPTRFQIKNIETYKSEL